MEFKDLAIKGMTFKDVRLEANKYENEAIEFTAHDGSVYVLTHIQDCCESVSIESIDGDLSDLVGTPLLMAEETYKEGDSDWGSSTWSFYKFATVNGYVTIRFFGESNGYYGESADLIKVC